MNFAERMRHAKGIPDAMLILAEGIDAVLAAKPAPADPWAAGSWGEFPRVGDRPETDFMSPLPHALGDADHTAVASVVVIDREALARVNEAIAKEHDPETLQALMARKRLIEDPGAIISAAVPEGERVRAEVGGEHITVDLAVVSEEVKEDRRRWARRSNIADFLPALDPAQAVEAFAQGGPMWLYLADRDAVMQMHDSKRRELVNMIEVCESPAQAQEVARDILKDADPAGAAESAVDSLVAEHEAWNG